MNNMLSLLHPNMLAILSYLARMILISGFLYGYYWCFLRNASFHRYNRFYLMAAAILSPILPQLNINIGGLGELGSPASAIGALHEITAGAWEESTELTRNPVLSQTFFNGQHLVYGIYLLVTCIFLLLVIRSFLFILRLAANFPQERVEGIRVFLTTEPRTPFSFFKNIFWNRRLDLNSPHGKQVFRHELFHVRQNHSLDILFLEMLRAAFWCNPFFHLIRKELKVTHEFLADRYAISGGEKNEHENNGIDKYEYAELLVWQAAGQHSPSLAHSFFNTHLQRRIIMLTQLQKTRPGYFSRIMVLPLVFLLFCAFATKVPVNKHADNSRRIARQGSPSKTLTVVIDAGHGGIDPGAHGKDVNEKDLVLALARKIKELSPAYNINVLLTRDKDELPGNGSTIRDGLRYRTAFANGHKADLFISLHLNINAADSIAGTQVYVSGENAYAQNSARLGSAMIDEMKKICPTSDQLRQRKEGVWVLKAADMPAIILVCGNMDDAKDLAFITDTHDREILARSILEGIRHYGADASAASATEPIGTSPAHAPTTATAPAQTRHTILHYYMQHLRYPQEALKNGQETTLWVAIKFGENGMLREFSSTTRTPDSDPNKWTALTIVARSLGTHSLNRKAESPAGEYLVEAFRDEAQKVSQYISSDKDAINFPPGDYFFKLEFKIESKQS